MLDKTSVSSFCLFLLFSFLLTVVDPRITVIAYFTLFIWQAFENWKKIIFLFISAMLLIPLNFYWIFPLIKIEAEFLSLGVSIYSFRPYLIRFYFMLRTGPIMFFGRVVQPLFILS